jgi:type I site-specific restriction endonuclease
MIDVFLRANQAQNVLFLADRDALVDHTLTSAALDSENLSIRWLNLLTAQAD